MARGVITLRPVPAGESSAHVARPLRARADQMIDEFAVPELCQNHQTPSGAIGNIFRQNVGQEPEIVPDDVR